MGKKYIRVTGHDFNDIQIARYLGRVGKVLSSNDRSDGNGMVFHVKIAQQSYLLCEWNIEFITKKEYFKGCLCG